MRKTRFLGYPIFETAFLVLILLGIAVAVLLRVKFWLFGG
jgi:hypothetical protein